ncbi:sodium:proton antiporter [bacterium]|nr:sodium:proton antiporter [bacterium]
MLEQAASIAAFVGQGLVLAGAIVTIIGSVGVLRFPDFYTRIHAASVTDTLGAGLIIVGLVLLGGGFFVTVKLLIIWGLILITGPTASHALANAAFTSHVKPLGRGDLRQPSASDEG